MADNSTRSRFLLSAGLLTVVVVGSGILFWSIEGSNYSLFDSIYYDGRFGLAGVQAT